MASPEDRVAKMMQALSEVVDVGGANERTQVVPNVMVINEFPTDLPDGFIIVEDEQGFYVPALKVPGMNYTPGDYVNLLRVQGTEPIAFMQGTGSNYWYDTLDAHYLRGRLIADEAPEDGEVYVWSALMSYWYPAPQTGGGAGGWPFDNIITVSQTNANADYSTITAAIAGASANDIILLDAGTYTEQVDVNKAVAIVGLDRDVTEITNASGDYTVSIEEHLVYIKGVKISYTGTAADSCAVKATHYCTYQDVFFNQAGSHSGDIWGLKMKTTGAFQFIYDSKATVTNSGSGNAHCTYNDISTILIIGSGTWQADGYSVWCDSGGSFRLWGKPYLYSGITGTGTITGEYTGDSVYGPTRYVADTTPDYSDVVYWYGNEWIPMEGFRNALMIRDRWISEQAPNQGEVLTWANEAGYWYPAPGGGGGVADGAWPFDNVLTVSQTNADADYSSIQDAIDDASAGDVILIDAGTWTEQVDLDKAVTLMGHSRADTVITNAAGDYTVDVTGSTAVLSNLKIIYTGTSNQGCCVDINTTTYMYEVDLETDSDTANDVHCIRIVGFYRTAYLFDVHAECTNVGAGTDYVLRASTGRYYIEGGEFWANNYYALWGTGVVDVYVRRNPIMIGPLLWTSSGDLYGEYNDRQGVTHYLEKETPDYSDVVYWTGSEWTPTGGFRNALMLRDRWIAPDPPDSGEALVWGGTLGYWYPSPVAAAGGDTADIEPLVWLGL